MFCFTDILRYIGSVFFNRYCLLISVLAYSGIVHAEQIEEKLSSGLIVTADYQAGQPQKPAVLVLHGFLQTRNYITVSTLTNAASELGHAVLAPTLSLGIDKRKQSLQCAAIHSHTVEGDLAEIDFWLNWLEKKHSSGVILIGHSFGSIYSLAYVTKRRNKSIKQVIATSLTGSMKDNKDLIRQIKKAKTNIKNKGLDNYSISYCKKYTAPAAAFLSYAEWGSNAILKSLKQTKIPFSVILGGGDRRIDSNWKTNLSKSGAKVVLIDGASHFFDNEHEFDLMEAIQKLLQK